ncbi:MAG: 1-acyl-sn-glycerol-3-phosphate acyltransferase [Clostridia bacterium]|nr:1-acyl-sn-glycerol-3-phosphate acyltransferase [Clostridia bacterium]
MFKAIVLLITDVLYVFYKTEVRGKENLPDGPFVLASNHISNWDPVFLYKKLKNKNIRFMAKKELFENKFLAWAIRKFGGFPVDRNSNDIKAVKTGLSVLKNGEVLGIFPQGTRCDLIDPENVKPGYIVFADRCNVPIVPVSITKSKKIRTHFTYTIGKPVSIDKEEKNLTPEEMEKLSLNIMTSIKKMAENV